MSYIGNQPLYSAFPSDTFSGTGSQTAYTMSVAPANTASVIVAISGVLQDPSTYSTSGTTLTFSAAPPTGTNNISVRYLGVPASGVTTTAYYARNSYTATAGQTSFTIPSYTVGFIQVFRNGVLLDTSDYTATTGTTVVLNSGATSGDTVTFISFLISSVLNAIPSTAGSVGSTNLAANLSLVTPSVTTTLGVGGATPANTGAGITFPATQSASTDANTLDDYEEGTWTPSQGANLTVSGSFISSGAYTKIGRMVYVSGYLAGSTNISWSAGGTIAGNLPFTAITSPQQPGSGIIGTTTVGHTTLAYNTSVYVASSQVATGTFFFNIAYQVA